jgi:hypothetical protein
LANPPKSDKKAEGNLSNNRQARAENAIGAMKII